MIWNYNHHRVDNMLLQLSCLKGRVKKTKVFSYVLLFIDITVVIFHKKVYNAPYPIRMILRNPMQQLQPFSVCYDIYKDCVQ